MQIDSSDIGGSRMMLETAPTLLSHVGDKRFAYRTLGTTGGVPLVLLQHFTGTMDYWDPAVVNEIAKHREVVVFDNVGVGASSGKASDSVDQMAHDALLFIESLGYAKVDVLGYSLGGMIAQVLAARNPGLVRKIVLANTAHQGGGNDLLNVLGQAMSQKTHADPRMVLFFPPTASGIEAGHAFLKRVSVRSEHRDPECGPDVANAQAKAIIEFTTTVDPSNALLRTIAQPVLVVSGSNDTMLPTDSSYAMFRILENARLVMYPNSGHGAIFQHAGQFCRDVETFLDD